MKSLSETVFEKFPKLRFITTRLKILCNSWGTLILIILKLDTQYFSHINFDSEHRSNSESLFVFIKTIINSTNDGGNMFFS